MNMVKEELEEQKKMQRTSEDKFVSTMQVIHFSLSCANCKYMTCCTEIYRMQFIGC